MNRSLDELTASELNDAIDDTNFPKAQSTTCLSTWSKANEESQSPNNGHQLNGKPATPHDPNAPNGNEIISAEETVDGVVVAGDDEEIIATPTTPIPISTPITTPIQTPTTGTTNLNNVQNGHKGFIKRTHPAPLKMVAFKGDSIDVPGTPRTPRTSTTPGKF